MKKKCLIMALLLLAFYFPSSTIAHKEQKKHYEDIELVLFGKEDAGLTGEEKRKLQAIEWAEGLAIDQFNGNNAETLKKLRELEIRDLPDDVTTTKAEDPIKGINYSSIFSEHRQYTHKGWDLSPSPYIDDLANWAVRRNIMLRAAEYTFGLRYNPIKPDSQCDAFCALVYYVHIIGDQENDSKYAPAAIIIPLGRKNAENTNNANESNPDIVSQLQYYLPRLFKEQQNSLTYKAMMLHLAIFGRTVRRLDDNGSVKGENIAKYQKAAEKLIHILSYYIPTLLRSEPFFTNTFSSVLQG